MTDDDRNRSRETEDAKTHLIQGLGHLWRAARAATNGLKKEIDRSNIGKSFEDAGRELTRAVTNVVERIEKEINNVQPGEPSYAKRPDPQDPQPWKQGGNNPRDEERQGSGSKPKGPTPEDPGFSIATTDPSSDDSKPQ